MAEPYQILNVLENLLHAFPSYNLAKETGVVYVRFLGDIPIELLWRAAERHIETSNFFPSISELRAHAAALAGTHRFDVQTSGLPGRTSFAPLRPGSSGQGSGQVG